MKNLIRLNEQQIEMLISKARECEDKNLYDQQPPLLAIFEMKMIAGLQPLRIRKWLGTNSFQLSHSRTDLNGAFASSDSFEGLIKLMQKHLLDNDIEMLTE